MVIHKPFTIVRNATALGVVLHVAGVLLHDRGGNGHLFLRDRRLRVHRLSIRSGEVRAAIAQVSSDYVFVRGDRALEVILGISSVGQACMRPTSIPPAVAPVEAVTFSQTLGELAAELLLDDLPAWAAE